jgi:hypothetical protein
MPGAAEHGVKVFGGPGEQTAMGTEDNRIAVKTGGNKRKGGRSAWNKLVGDIYAENKHKPGYKLGHAMKDAKKIYRKTAKAPGARKNKTARRRRG